MNFPLRLEAFIVRNRARSSVNNFASPRPRLSLVYSRTYASHRDATPSSLLSSALDQKHRSARRDDSVGPFQLGVSQASLNKGEKIKKWSELSTSGKVVRTTQRTTNLTVILLGAGLSAVLVYALTSELFSKNSPTVLYGDACQRIKDSARVAKYLHGPLVFHNNPPSAIRPRHRNRHVSSQIAVDPTGREHMLLNFYVQGQDPASKLDSAAKSESYLDSITRKISSLTELTLDESIDWTKERALNAWETSKRAFKYLSGDIVSSPSTSRNHIPERPKEEEEPSVWSFAGLFSGLKGKKLSAEGTLVRSNGQIFTDGEVHADLIRNDDGYFVFRYLLIDIPNSGSRNPIRVFVEQGPGVRENERIMRFQ
ncbi:TIM21-domain-containing protein [Hygrophoropsis aurantiaca]|uniref:TIM21-domain-containing protein n=1 Tax=Hygrophoropsis aurantiaca TaxID=72124 RepID=A0ACB8AQ49_9AGAM|nr:TIM21-domain-containing protein [Hygrophoropsis aurantiaca]